MSNYARRATAPGRRSFSHSYVSDVMIHRFVDRNYTIRTVALCSVDDATGVAYRVIRID